MYSDLLSDHDLIDAQSTSRLRTAEAKGDRTYIAAYENGDTRTFAVASAGHAQVYAREYGTRILGSKLVDCRWNH